ncbi:MAG: RsmD family RNA methyltransferase [Bacteroidetes bacterium]|jgi:16S rRNA (guanine(966)-N(2))-methyltransferase RsmD|nr:RsmD family RNA methyltransferase [Bacteroidota bacterium]
MRIIAGKYGGRRINPPSNMPHTRPTTDVAKEGLFNILQSRISLDEANTLDLFGGTGCISYELASRGASALTIVEKDNQMLDFIKKNIDLLKIENAQTIRMDVFQYLASCTQQFDIIFAGPPYALTTIDDLPRIIVERKLISPEGYFILEHTPRNNYENFAGFSFQRNYGATVFSFFE